MINVRGIAFKYAREKRQVLDKIDFSILGGESVALLGVNGSGKSTLLKVMLGILYPEQGTVVYDGVSVQSNRIKVVNNIGVVWGQKSNLWWDVSVKRSMNILKKIYGITDEQFENRINELDSKLSFKGYWNKPLRKLSLGQRIKCEIVAATLHNPDILFFDEPFIGLDFMTRNEIMKMLKEYKHNNKNSILVLTSHNIKDIEELCDRVILMDSGTIIYDDNMENIQKRFHRKAITIKHSNSDLIINNEFEEITIENEGNGITKIIVDGMERTDVELLKELVELNEIIDIQLEDVSLEAAIEEMTKY